MEEDIKILEEIIDTYNDCAGDLDVTEFDMCVDIRFMKKQTIALKNLIKGYKEKEEDLKLHEKTSFEFQEENIKLNKVINKMAEFMAGGNYYNYATKEMVIKEFMEEVENE